MQPQHPTRPTYLQQLQLRLLALRPRSSVRHGGKHGGLAARQRLGPLLKQRLVRLQRLLLLGAQRQLLLRAE